MINPAKMLTTIGPAVSDLAKVLESVHAQLELMNEKLDKLIELNERGHE